VFRWDGGAKRSERVSAALHKRMKSSVLEGNEEMVQGRMGRVENRHVRKPNVRLSGPEWA
jgi:hypothetical protein